MELLCAASVNNQYPNQKPYFGFSRLALGHHSVVGFRIVKNKLYRADSEKPGLPKTLLVELEDQVLFMPDYISKVFIDDEQKVAELNSDNIKKVLFFGGRRKNG